MHISGRITSTSESVFDDSSNISQTTTNAVTIHRSRSNSNISTLSLYIPPLYLYIVHVYIGYPNEKQHKRNIFVIYKIYQNLLRITAAEAAVLLIGQLNSDRLTTCRLVNSTNQGL